MVALPIDAHLPEILAALEARGAAVIVAEPGAGKTTRVPPALLERVRGEIVVLEPRRIAARLAAGFVAEELGEPVGERVGYQVRFDSKVSKRTRLRFVTEGILLRRLASDPGLRGVSAVVFDELHERHLQGDLALALAKAARADPRREERLLLLAMSATLDAKPVCGFLDAPEIRVAGRTFPVTIEHEAASDVRDLDRQVASALKRVLQDPGGDVLVFLPGAAEIRAAESRCRSVCKSRGVELTTLHGRMKPAEQHLALRAQGPRRVVLSTNVAESSVTLPRVTTVIDSGLERRARHDPWSGLPSLAVERISVASAVQRSGRAGRVQNGHCIRLFSEADLRGRDIDTPPEVRRLDLCEWSLTLRTLGHDPSTFSTLEAPPKDALDAADGLLRRLGALDGEAVTDRGRRMHSMPTHPRLARLIDEGCARGVGTRATWVAALIAEREVRRQEREASGVGSADVLYELEALEGALAEGLRPRELAARGFFPESVRTVSRAQRQLARAARVGDEIRDGFVDEEDALRLAILAAFSDRVGARDGERLVFPRGGAAKMDPASVVRAGAFAAALAVRTDRQRRPLVTSACEVDAEMILELFPDDVEVRTSVRFDSKTEQVESVEALVFDGLVLDESIRRDGFGPDVARALAEAAMDAGLGRFFDMDALTLFRHRVDFARARGAEVDAVEDGSIAAALEHLCVGRRSFADLRNSDLVDALHQTLGGGVARLAKWAPTHVVLGKRRKVTVNYEADRPPWIASRLQDFFGMREGPRIGGEPLVLHLLAPNRRAVQVTTDLAGFWERHYPALRRQLMRRYSRHAWPEDPLVG